MGLVGGVVGEKEVGGETAFVESGGGVALVGAVVVPRFERMFGESFAEEGEALIDEDGREEREEDVVAEACGRT